MKTTASNRKLRALLTAIADNTLSPRPEFQRRLVWANKHKIAFIRTVLNGYPFPEIYIAAGDVDTETGIGSEMLVDGQQRITTLFQYFRGSPELRLPKDLSAYRDLEQKRKLAFLEYDVVVRDLGAMPLHQIKRIFQLINSTGYSLNAMETQNARFNGVLKRFGENFVGLPFFEEHRIFSQRELRRMHDLRFGLTIVITMLSTYFNRDEELEPYLEKYNEQFPHAKTIRDEIEHILRLIDSMHFPADLRVWKLTDIFTLFCELHRAVFRAKLVIHPQKLSKSLTTFYEKVELSKTASTIDKAISDYHKASIQATNDRSSRITRGEVVSAVIQQHGA